MQSHDSPSLTSNYQSETTSIYAPNTPLSINADDIVALTTHLNQKAVVQGKIETVYFGKTLSGTNPGQPYAFLNFGDWTDDCFRVVIWSETLKQFSNDGKELSNLQGKRMAVFGTITNFKDRLQIVLHSRANLYTAPRSVPSNSPTPKHPARKKRRPSYSQPPRTSIPRKTMAPASIPTVTFTPPVRTFPSSNQNRQPVEYISTSTPDAKKQPDSAARPQRKGKVRDLIILASAIVIASLSVPPFSNLVWGVVAGMMDATIQESSKSVLTSRKVTTVHEAFIYAGPGKGYDSAGSIPPSTSVTIFGYFVDTQGTRWYQLDKDYWIASDDVGFVELDGLPMVARD